jgi:hypothetical protein
MSKKIPICSVRLELYHEYPQIYDKISPCDFMSCALYKERVIYSQNPPLPAKRGYSLFDVSEPGPSSQHAGRGLRISE